MRKKERMRQIICCLSLCFALGTMAADLPKLNQSFGAANAKTDGDLLTVSTGAATRQWKWTEKGFLTQSLAGSDGKIIAVGAGKTADWDLGDLGDGKLVSLKAFENDDEHFTSRHLAIEAEIEYPTLLLKYVIWAYPGAPGFRTQIWLKTPEKISTLGAGISEELMLSSTPVSVTAWGYRAGLKAGMTPYEVLKTKELGTRGESKKTSGLMADLGGCGVMLVKESHAHTHIPDGGCSVGGFRRDDKVLQVDGLGILPEDVSSKYKFCWGNWMILYEGSEIDAEMALKQFDRFRYPVNPNRDVFIMANTWGSEDMIEQCKYKAREENVLREIEACANLGVDLLQIDDGWQGRDWLPKASASPKKVKPKKKKQNTDEVSEHHILLNGDTVPAKYDVYPDGFGTVRDTAAAAGIKLGLWHAWRAPLKAIQTNMENGDFKAFKLDFAVLKEKEALDHLYYKGREIVKHSGYSAVVNWDVTEAAPRMGFYFGRDCGNLYLENRKAATVRNQVLYNPWHILRDAWLLAKYTNLNKIQLTYQNKDLVPPEAETDARDYPHDYNMAITLMSSPILFTETQMLTDEAVGILKPMLAKYKAERADMYQGYVFAIGAMPDNESWTGLQNHNPETGKGYLMIFRELKNKEPRAKLALHFMKPGTKLKLTDVLTGKRRNAVLNDGSELEFEIQEAPGFLFLKYE